MTATEKTTQVAPKFEIQTGNSWRPMYNARPARGEYRRLLAADGAKQRAADDSDLDRGIELRTPEGERLDEIDAAARPLVRDPASGVVVRATTPTATVELHIFAAPEPLGCPGKKQTADCRMSVDGRKICDAQVSLQSILDARRDWAGTGGMEERLYDLAAHLIFATAQRVQFHVSPSSPDPQGWIIRPTYD